MKHTVGVLFDYYDDDAYLYTLEKLVTTLQQEAGTRIIKHERPPIGSRYRIYINYEICYKVEQTPTEED